MLAIKDDVRYTYEDYLTWNDDNRWEIIDGKAYMMSAPSASHQRIFSRVFNKVYTFLEGRTCEVFPAPFDVRLSADKYDDTVVQPDISIVCDRKKIEPRGCKGAPDFIIEILSPSTTYYDFTIKKEKYLSAGVKEYWIIDPIAKKAIANILENGRYTITLYNETDNIPSHVLQGLEINLTEIFLKDDENYA
jgi:Uma2 family endonuclease